MKKAISTISALAMVMAIAPMSAFADTTIKQTDTLPKTADSSVEFSVDPTYTVTIPAKIELADNGSGIYTNIGTLTAEDVFLEPNQEIVVTISGDFVLENEADSSVTVDYQAEGPNGIVGNGDIVTAFDTSDEPQSVNVEFSTSEEPEYAGNYSDTVTFGISVETLN